jgi:hypothetical protein
MPQTKAELQAELSDLRFDHTSAQADINKQASTIAALSRDLHSERAISHAAKQETALVRDILLDIVSEGMGGNRR